MRKLLVALITIVVLGCLTGQALAGKGGNGGGDSSAVTGTIALDTSGARVAEAAAWPRYGDMVAFTTTVSGRMDPKGYVYVQVVCAQGSNIVYVWSADPAFEFPLVQQDGFAALGNFWDTSIPASCEATLIYRIDKRSDIINYLASAPFTAQPSA